MAPSEARIIKKRDGARTLMNHFARFFYRLIGPRSMCVPVKNTLKSVRGLLLTI